MELECDAERFCRCVVFIPIVKDTWGMSLQHAC